MSSHEQIAEARKSVLALKKVTPYIFREWQELQAAKVAVSAARRRYEQAKKEWDALGKDHP